MSATYDPSLPTDRDTVRFLLGDTDITNARLTDEEIVAILATTVVYVGQGAWTPYFAAATLLEGLVAKLRTSLGGKTSESVGSLSLSYGGTGEWDSLTGNNPTGALSRARILREQGAALKLPRPKIMGVL